MEPIYLLYVDSKLMSKQQWNKIKTKRISERCEESIGTLLSEHKMRKPNDYCMELIGSGKQIILYILKRDENHEEQYLSTNQKQTRRKWPVVYDPKTLNLFFLQTIILFLVSNSSDSIGA